MSMLNVFPGLPMEDALDTPQADPKPPRQFALAKLIAQGANLANLIFGQLCIAVVFAARRKTSSKGVARISGRGDPFQVGEAVVGFEAVDVISLLLPGGWPDEGCKDEAMNVGGYVLALTAEANLEIAAVGQARHEDSVRPSTSGPPNPTDPSEVRDLVPAFITNDGLPVFKGGCARLGVHRKGLLSLPRGRAPHSVAATPII